MYEINCREDVNMCESGRNRNISIRTPAASHKIVGRARASESCQFILLATHFLSRISPRCWVAKKARNTIDKITWKSQRRFFALNSPHPSSYWPDWHYFQERFSSQWTKEKLSKILSFTSRAFHHKTRGKKSLNLYENKNINRHINVCICLYTINTANSRNIILQ